MTIIIILSIIAVAIIVASVIIYKKNKTPKDEELERVVESVKANLKGDLKDSATNLIKGFLWYSSYDPNKPIEEQSGYNRQQRRRIKRHYEKFLWKWTDIPEEAQNIAAIAEYLAHTKWETRVVRRYINLMKDTPTEGGADE